MVGLALGASLLAGCSGVGHAAEPPTGPAILQQLRSFATMGSVLYVAAHPDDENTQVITYLARGRGYRTAYLSLTRGDGGQNLLGPQLGEAARRGAHAGAARRAPAGRRAAVLHPREGLRLLEELRGDAAASGTGRPSSATSCA